MLRCRNDRTCGSSCGWIPHRASGRIWHRVHDGVSKGGASIPTRVPRPTRQPIACDPAQRVVKSPRWKSACTGSKQSKPWLRGQGRHRDHQHGIATPEVVFNTVALQEKRTLSPDRCVSVPLSFACNPALDWNARRSQRWRGRNKEARIGPCEIENTDHFSHDHLIATM